MKIGDLITTADGDVLPIKWIGRRSYRDWLAVGNPEVQPILFKAGSIADHVPARDLYVSPEHAMFLDGVLIPARHLVNGVSILKIEGMEEIEYFHFEFDRHVVIYAEGAAAESFVDDDSRMLFHNADEYRRLYPDEPLSDRLIEFCAPRASRTAIRNLETLRRGLTAGHRRGAAAAGRRGPPRRRHGRVTLTGPRAPWSRAGPLRERETAIRSGWRSWSTVRWSVRPWQTATVRTWARTGVYALATGYCSFRFPSCPTPCRPNCKAVTGWALDPFAPESRVALAIKANGEVIGRIVADELRPDLERAGKGDGHCSFRFTDLKALARDTAHRIEVCREIRQSSAPRVAPSSWKRWRRPEAETGTTEARAAKPPAATAATGAAAIAGRGWRP